MKKINIAKHKFKSSACTDHEAGVALIFALGILALLLIMLIGFLASSLLEQRIAYNQGSQVGSKLIARSALVRVKSQLADKAEDLIWMRYRSESGAKRLQPLVSGTAFKTSETEAFKDYFKPLLEKYDIDPANWFKSTGTTYYPDWVYMSTSDGNDRRLVGRMAYMVLPNLGIDPTLLADDGAQIGKEYKELPVTGLTFMTGNSHLDDHSHWLSTDLMTGKKGMLADVDIDDATRNLFETNDVEKKELVNIFFTTNQKMSRERVAPHTSGSSSRFNIAESFNESQARSILGSNFSPADKHEQVAANMVDYVDADSIPTSNPGADPANWLTTEPTYTGNEMTPYINQIAPSVKLDAQYTEDLEISSDGIYRNGTQTVTVTVTPEVTAELINIYAEKMGHASSVYVDAKLTASVQVVQCTGTITGAAKQFVFDLSGAESTQISDMDKNSYDTCKITAPAQTHTFTVVHNDTRVSRGLELLVSVFVNEIQIGKAVLKYNNANVDYAAIKGTATRADILVGSSAPGTPGTPGTPGIPGTPGAPGAPGGGIQAPATWRFPNVGSSVSITAYANWEVADPRCNLESEYWISDNKIEVGNADNLGSRNSNADAENDDVTVAKDLEPEKDPAKLSTAFIRNAPMESAWELGFIHRGEPWKTLNLKSAANPLDSNYSSRRGTYWDDASILDRIKLKASIETNKFNINLPASYWNAFGVLTDKLKYHKVDEGVFKLNGTNLDLDVAGTESLDNNAWEDLTKWIANKCYNAASDDPANSSSDRYPRYINRGMLANVIMDWMRKSSASPYKGAALSDAVVEELVAKIAPLTRCGDAVEYFTVFAVGQSLKDLKGTIYQYSSSGTPENPKNDCKYGTWDEGYDKVTSDTFLVARLCRELEKCVNADSCKRGIHAVDNTDENQNCKFKVTVLESYTLSEL